MAVEKAAVLLEEYKVLAAGLGSHRGFFPAVIPALLTIAAGFCAILASDRLATNTLPYICIVCEWALALAYIWGVIGHANVASSVAHLASLEHRLNEAVGLASAYPSLSNLATFNEDPNLGLSYHRALLGSGLRSLPNYRVCVNLLSAILMGVMVILAIVAGIKAALLTPPWPLQKVGLIAAALLPFIIAIVCSVMVYRLENRLRDHLAAPISGTNREIATAQAAG